jgi:hypothetical protein
MVWLVITSATLRVSLGVTLFGVEQTFTKAAA